MALAERLAQHLVAPPRPCKVAQAQEKLQGQDRDAFIDALADTEKYSAPVLVRLLREEGFEMSPQSIHRHRNSACTCVNGARA